MTLYIFVWLFCSVGVFYGAYQLFCGGSSTFPRDVRDKSLVLKKKWTLSPFEENHLVILILWYK